MVKLDVDFAELSILEELLKKETDKIVEEGVPEKDPEVFEILDKVENKFEEAGKDEFEVWLTKKFRVEEESREEAEELVLNEEENLDVRKVNIVSERIHDEESKNAEGKGKDSTR